ncbi:pecanex-like protein 3 isoform X2 [Myiozetetes cayanensis]|uniref:pecanex-like protein 3 isoform X2 n=1 Tax=Myiozetetes cayanensis TaxID=478635 RepID=UPI0021604120|nr:pecanex-like protein 3 isoform X2 [Myiozetetes cayanensis]
MTSFARAGDAGEQPEAVAGLGLPGGSGDPLGGPGAAMAGAAALQVLRQGVWASLTGGCFLDPQLGAFANCVRLYVWLFLLGLPLGLYSALPPTPTVAALYCGVVAAFFGAVKAVTFRLHARLDRRDPQGDPEGGAAALLPPRCPEEGDGSPGLPGGGLELSVLRWPRATPPQLCGFNQLSELLPHLDMDSMGELRSSTSGSGIVTAADREHLCCGPPAVGGHPGGWGGLGEAQGLREGSPGGASGGAGVPLTLAIPPAPENPLAAGTEGEVPPGSPPPTPPQGEGPSSPCMALSPHQPPGKTPATRDSPRGVRGGP